MPWTSPEAGHTIVIRENVDCPECHTTIPDVEFDTGAYDEDGLADLTVGDLETRVACPECGNTFAAQAEGWLMFGEAG